MVGLSDTSYIGWVETKKPPPPHLTFHFFTGNRQSNQIWCASGMYFLKCKINLKSAIIFAHVSIFLSVVNKSGKIGQNQGNCDKFKFGEQFPPKHDNSDRTHQVTLHYKRNLQNIQILILYSRKLRFEDLRFFQGQSQKIVSPPSLFKIFQ